MLRVKSCPPSTSRSLATGRLVRGAAPPRVASTVARAAAPADGAGAGAMPSHAQPKQQARGNGHAVSRRQLINMGAATMAFMACPCCTNLGEAKAESWGYATNVIITGPQAWPGLCQVGMRQSPVTLSVRDRPRTNSPDYADIDFQYGKKADSAAFVSNPGHGSMQLNFAPGKIAVINGEEYELLQYHFHTPSEHAFDGHRYAMEAHLVHKSLKTGGLAVVGVMLEPEGEVNPCLEVGLLNAPQPGDIVNLKEPVDPMQLLPPPDKNGHRGYVHYSGSLTTPPCSENVNWFVMTQPLLIGDRQILRFMKFVGGQRTYGQNSRPLNPLLDRVVDYDL